MSPGLILSSLSLSAIFLEFLFAKENIVFSPLRHFSDDLLSPEESSIKLVQMAKLSSAIAYFLFTLIKHTFLLFAN